MADDTDTHRDPDSFGDLPIQPTGSGVADLEIAYEQMRLSESEAGDGGAMVDPALDADVPVEGGRDADESEAHPS